MVGQLWMVWLLIHSGPWAQPAFTLVPGTGSGALRAHLPAPRNALILQEYRMTRFAFMNLDPHTLIASLQDMPESSIQWPTPWLKYPLHGLLYLSGLHSRISRYGKHKPTWLKILEIFYRFRLRTKFYYGIISLKTLKIEAQVTFRF